MGCLQPLRGLLPAVEKLLHGMIAVNPSSRWPAPDVLEASLALDGLKEDDQCPKPPTPTHTKGLLPPIPGSERFSSKPGGSTMERGKTEEELALQRKIVQEASAAPTSSPGTPR